MTKKEVVIPIQLHKLPSISKNHIEVQDYQMHVLESLVVLLCLNHFLKVITKEECSLLNVKKKRTHT